jgi:hypothetical protein
MLALQRSTPVFHCLGRISGMPLLAAATENGKLVESQNQPPKGSERSPYLILSCGACGGALQGTGSCSIACRAPWM